MKYLTVALYHPRVMKGGAQYVAKDLHDAATADPAVDAVLLAGIDGAMFPQYMKVGAAITSLPDSPSEYIMGAAKFDDFYHVIYDPRRNKALRRFLEDHQPDVIHIHHSLWVGLEFLELARKTLPNVKIVYTLHEYLAICYAQGQLFRYHEGAICRDTSPDQCVKCFPNRTADEFTLRRRSFRQAFGLVDHFIAPSGYLRDRFIDWGLAPDRISVIANGHSQSRPSTGWTAPHTQTLSTFGFFGQFVDAKGIDVLLRAASLAATQVEQTIEIKLYGGNKQYASPAYVEKIDAVLAAKPDNLKVTEIGSYSRENVFDLMCGVDWVVMPSVWPETFGLVISEAWDAKRPVLGARAGGITNRVIHGVNGLTFQPGSSTELAGLIAECINNQALWQRLSSGVADEVTMAEAWTRHRDVIAAL